MTAFFHSGRRKMGVLTLVLAMAFSVLLVRSGSVVDLIKVPIGTNSVVSGKHTLYWERCYYAEAEQVGYIDVPLTLLSAYLLLSKPQLETPVKSQVPSSP